jgi:hypothetical protein
MKFTQIIVYILLGALVVFAIYKYFALDTNKDVQDSFKEGNLTKAELAIRTVISEKLASEAKQYLHDHNNYFVSKSNNLCLSAKSLFAGLEQFTSNPVECVAQTHSFTARIKRVGSDSYFCADAKGFNTISVTEEGYVAGVKCK